MDIYISYSKKREKKKTRKKGGKKTISKHLAMFIVVLNRKKLRIATRFCEAYFLWIF